ncbi:MAG: hypothetical protein AAGH64_00200 [Planctomycetota bacterium]
MHARTMIVAIAALSAPALAGTSISADLLASADGAVQFSGVLGFEALTDGPSISTRRSGGNNVRHGVFEFDLSSIPAGATITGATLRLTTAGLISNTGGNPADIEFFAWAGDGAVTEGDHGDQPMPEGSLVADESYPSDGTIPINTLLDIPFDSLAELQGALDADAPFLSVRSQTFNFATFNVHSLETDNSAVLRPTLVVEYVPSPGGVALAALVSCAGARRRRSDV